jgi:hypothetical protein
LSARRATNDVLDDERRERTGRHGDEREDQHRRAKGFQDWMVAYRHVLRTHVA